MNGNKLRRKELNRILKQVYLYRGTNSFDFEAQSNKEFYSGRITSEDKHITSTSTLLMYAMVNGSNRCKTTCYKRENAKPVLLAIRAENYTSSLEKGLEPPEIEINGKIDWKDITVVDSLDKLAQVCPNAHPNVVNYFKEHYLGQKDA